MKKLFSFVILFLFANPTRGNSNTIVFEDHDGIRVAGELVHRYEARWFWQTLGEQWIAVLPEGQGIEGLRFFPESSIKIAEQYKSSQDNFLKKMNERGYQISRLPFAGSNSVSTGHDGHHLHEFMYGDFAWDFEKRKNKSSHHGDPNRITSYHTWGESVYSPVSGVIVDIEKSVVDNRADPTLSNSLEAKGDGNFILIKLGDQFFMSLLHFQKDSIPKSLKVGTRVQVGDFLGRVGNSGRSYLPHLHMTTYFYSEFWQRMFSVPNSFARARQHQAEGHGTLKNFIPLTGHTYSNRRGCF